MERQSNEKRLEMIELPAEAKDLVSECELTGRRTYFQRNGRAVAVLISHDEYLALRETIEIANDAPLREKIAAAEQEAARNAVMLPEDLFGE